MNVRENRPEVQESSCQDCGLLPSARDGRAELAQMTSTVLGGFVRSEAVAQGIQRGLRFLSLMVGGGGLLVVALLATAHSIPLPSHNLRQD